jgi:hypothetical protein
MDKYKICLKVTLTSFIFNITRQEKSINNIIIPQSFFDNLDKNSINNIELPFDIDEQVLFIFLYLIKEYDTNVTITSGGKSKIIEGYGIYIDTKLKNIAIPLFQLLEFFKCQNCYLIFEWLHRFNCKNFFDINYKEFVNTYFKKEMIHYCNSEHYSTIIINMKRIIKKKMISEYFLYEFFPQLNKMHFRSEGISNEVRYRERKEKIEKIKEAIISLYNKEHKIFISKVLQYSKLFENIFCDIASTEKLQNCINYCNNKNECILIQFYNIFVKN